MKTQSLLQAMAVAILATGFACQSGPSQADETAIRQRITEDFKTAWDINDEAAIAAMFTEDATLSFPTSSWIHGRQAIQQAFSWDDFADGRQIDLELSDIRWLDPGTALVYVDATFTGGVDGHGQRFPDSWDSAVMVLRKHGGQWLYEALHVMPMRQDWNAVNEAIADTWAGFTEHWHAGNVDGFMAYYTDQSDNLGMGMPDQFDKMAIRDWMSTVLSGQTVSNLQIEQQRLDIMGPIAYQYGTFSQTWTDQTGTSRDQHGHMMCQFRRGADGVWRFDRCMLTDRNKPEN